MEETPNTSGELDRRRRGHRRGQITKLRNKVQDMQEAHPDTFDLILIDELLADLHTQVSAIEDLQEKIDFIYEAHPDLAIDEEPEKDRLDDAHKALKCTLLTLKKAGPLSHGLQRLAGPDSRSSKQTTARVSSFLRTRGFPALSLDCHLQCHGSSPV